MIILIDNYDSFTYNLYHIAAKFAEVKVFKNDEISAAEVAKLNPTHIIISPGPGKPSDAGNCKEIILKNIDIPILGVCLGHQAIAEVFGAKVSYAKKVMHGKQCAVHIANGNAIFQSLPPCVNVARYHSLAVLRENLPDELLVIAEDMDGEIMGIKHKDYNIFGVQFHPESILTENGESIVNNFIAKIEKKKIIKGQVK